MLPRNRFAFRRAGEGEGQLTTAPFVGSGHRARASVRGMGGGEGGASNTPTAAIATARLSAPATSAAGARRRGRQRRPSPGARPENPFLRCCLHLVAVHPQTTSEAPLVVGGGRRTTTRLWGWGAEQRPMAATTLSRTRPSVTARWARSGKRSPERTVEVEQFFRPPAGRLWWPACTRESAIDQLQLCHSLEGASVGPLL